MAGRIGHEALLGALAHRYDFHSTRAILAQALAHAGLAPAPSYSPEEASRIVWGLNCIGQRAQPAVMAVLELVGCAATADLPGPEQDEEEGEEVAVDQANLPLLLAQLVDAAVASARQRAQERARPRTTPEDPAAAAGPERKKLN